jgi:hypothetical protein
MAIIHSKLAKKLNNILIPSLATLELKKSFEPVKVDEFEDPDDPTEIFLALTSDRIQTRLSLENKEWILWAYKSNKDGSVSKRFPEKFIYLNVPKESFADEGLVLREWMKNILKLESEPQFSESIQAEALFQYHYKPAMKAALQNSSIVSSRAEIERVKEKKDSKVWFWIVGVFIVIFLLTSNGGSELPENCNYVPDPRGGYLEC